MALKYQFANAEGTLVDVYEHPPPIAWDKQKNRPLHAYGSDMALWISHGRPQPSPYQPPGN